MCYNEGTKIRFLVQSQILLTFYYFHSAELKITYAIFTPRIKEENKCFSLL